MRSTHWLVSASILVLLTGAGCSTPVPATVTMHPTTPIKANATLFVTSNQQRPRVVQSLEDAGFRVTDTWKKAEYAIDVRIGSKRGTTQPCGTSNNVVYIVTANGVRIMIIKGRGFTGTCSPNIFDDMSDKLSSYGG